MKSSTLRHKLDTEKDPVEKDLTMFLCFVFNIIHTIPMCYLGQYCAGTFDGWLCWPDTPVGSFAYERCPDFITGFDPTRKF